ncbi:hypothetical protein ATW55_05330 [Ferroacidibacillus organovorans]|uniref:Uncharacterized protein n=1 Tax=Ferroacidibacillus organovorans TaxID=1765683 RepID=A0A101XQQ2_9BACL|nr:hypothetical protein ATW55_05330 [Ferroacidibacillus organovorans]
MVPHAHLHTFIGRHVIVHTHQHEAFHGHVQGVTSTHLLLHGHQLVSSDTSEPSNFTILTDKNTCPSEMNSLSLVYFPGAALAVPLFAIAGITALGLGAMGAW